MQQEEGRLQRDVWGVAHSLGHSILGLDSVPLEALTAGGQADTHLENHVELVDWSVELRTAGACKSVCMSLPPCVYVRACPFSLRGMHTRMHACMHAGGSGAVIGARACLGALGAEDAAAPAQVCGERRPCAGRGGSRKDARFVHLRVRKWGGSVVKGE